MTLRDAWDAQADDWAAFARTPGHDRAHERLNFPSFLDLLPPPRGRTLDIGCGEAELGAVLVERGYDVIGVDSSPRMVELARERHESIVADAAALPFADSSFARGRLHVADERRRLDGVVAEAARVLERGGHVCAAVLHPLAAGAWTDKESADSAFAVTDYFNGPLKPFESERDGIRVSSTTGRFRSRVTRRRSSVQGC